MESCAAEIAESCSEHFPPNSDEVVASHVRIAVMHQIRGRSQEAFSLLQSLLDRHPALKRRIRNGIVSTLAAIRREDSDDQEVVPLLEEICSSNALPALDLDLRSSALDLAEAFLKVGQNSPAFAILEPAVSIPNQDLATAARSKQLLGLAYLQLDKDEEALLWFGDVVETSVTLDIYFDQSTHMSIIGLKQTHESLDMNMEMVDYIERMMDIMMQKPDAIHSNQTLWELIWAGDTLILCEDSEPVVMLRNITSGIQSFVSSLMNWYRMEFYRNTWY